MKIKENKSILKKVRILSSIKINNLVVASLIFLFSTGSIGVMALSSAPTNHNPNYSGPTDKNHSQIAKQINLSNVNLRTCQSYETSIIRIIKNVDTRVQNQISLFSSTALRVESFYNLKSKTIANYSQLIKAIGFSQAKVYADFEVMKSNSNFGCQLNNPKLIISTFQSNLKTQLADLKTYRINITNLIIALAAANNTAIASNGKGIN